MNINCVGVLLILTDISCCSVNNPDFPTLGPARQWVRGCLLISHLGINWTTSNPFLRTPFLDSLSQNWEGYKLDNKALSRNTFLGLCLDKLNSRNTISEIVMFKYCLTICHCEQLCTKASNVTTKLSNTHPDNVQNVINRHCCKGIGMK